MKLKLFLDEDIHMGLSHALRQRGFDVIHAQDLERKRKSDSEQLAFAVPARAERKPIPPPKHRSVIYQAAAV